MSKASGSGGSGGGGGGPPRQPIKVTGNSNVICEEAEIRGSVILGDKNIVHPKCRIVSEAGGTIIIGSFNIIEENVQIINWSPKDLVIGDNNLFEVGCFFEGVSVGNNCIIEPKATVAAGTLLGDNCVGHDRRKQSKPSKTQLTLHYRHLDYLHDVLKKFHSMKVK